jgi:hypothetical protein
MTKLFAQLFVQQGIDAYSLLLNGKRAIFPLNQLGVILVAQKDTASVGVALAAAKKRECVRGAHDAAKKEQWK